MATNPNPPSEPKLEEYPEELQVLLLKAQSGDATVLDKVRRELIARPELRKQLGHLGVQAEKGAHKWANCNNLLWTEFSHIHAAEMRSKLRHEDDSELESLMIDRMVMTWITLQKAEIDYADARNASIRPDSPLFRETAVRRQQCHNLHLSAVRALATVRKLNRRALSAVDLLRHPVPEGMPRRVTNRARFAEQHSELAN